MISYTNIIILYIFLLLFWGEFVEFLLFYLYLYKYFAICSTDLLLFFTQFFIHFSLLLDYQYLACLQEGCEDVEV